MNAKDYFERLEILLFNEECAEIEQHDTRIATNPLSRLVDEGYAWWPIEADKPRIGMHGNYKIELENLGDNSIPHRFFIGNQVTIFSRSFSGGRQEPLRGRITFLDKSCMHVQLGDDDEPDGKHADLPEWLGYGNLGVRLEANLPTYKRMRKALQAWKNENLPREKKRFRDVLLGQLAPEFVNAVLPLHCGRDALNESQENAIQKVITAREVALVHGPPGTGKTKTLIEAIVRILASGQARLGSRDGESQNSKRILVTAASNKAVDLLTAMLHERGVKVLRVGNPEKITTSGKEVLLENWMAQDPDAYFLQQLRTRLERYLDLHARTKQEIEILQKGNKPAAYTKSLHHYLGEIKRLKKLVRELEKHIAKRVLQEIEVVTATLYGSGSPILNGIPFSMVIIDEAGQALEPNVWIAMQRANKVIMAGDHQQLPPVVKSQVEDKSMGLGITLFERLMENTKVQVLLDRQYRMNSKIMHISNHEFYGGELKADETVKDHKIPFEEDKKILEFIDTKRLHQFEKLGKGGSSFRNEGEALLLFAHLRQFVNDMRGDSEKYTIGIIAPYSAQIKLLSQMHVEEMVGNEIWKDLGKNIEVNTIDSFQGQERDVIYISLVRSNKIRQVGFLEEVRRMNVAITRACKKLVVIGDSETIGKVEFYQNFIRYVIEVGHYRLASEFLSELYGQRVDLKD